MCLFNLLEYQQALFVDATTAYSGQYHVISPGDLELVLSASRRALLIASATETLRTLSGPARLDGSQASRQAAAMQPMLDMLNDLRETSLGYMQKLLKVLEGETRTYTDCHAVVMSVGGKCDGKLLFTCQVSFLD